MLGRGGSKDQRGREEPLARKKEGGGRAGILELRSLDKSWGDKRGEGDAQKSLPKSTGSDRSSCL